MSAPDPTAEHDPRCYQSTGVPEDLPPGLCDCKVLRMIDAAAPDASSVDTDTAAKPDAYRVSLDLTTGEIDVTPADTAQAEKPLAWDDYTGKIRRLERERSELRSEVQRLGAMLSTFGFCPKDGDSMPCTTCGAGL